jgi:hypothetical protein
VEPSSQWKNSKRVQARGSGAFLGPCKSLRFRKRGAPAGCGQSGASCRHQGSSVTLGSDDQQWDARVKRQTQTSFPSCNAKVRNYTSKLPRRDSADLGFNAILNAYAVAMWTQQRREWVPASPSRVPQASPLSISPSRDPLLPFPLPSAADRPSMDPQCGENN